MKGSHRPFLFLAGRLVNFLTFKKGIDFFQKMSIIIIVRGKRYKSQSQNKN